MKDSSYLAFVNPSVHVKRCLAGCVHITFDAVSLHFACTSSFLGFVDAVLTEAAESPMAWGYEVNYDWIALRLEQTSMCELCLLLKDARDAAEFLDQFWSPNDFSLKDLMRQCADEFSSPKPKQP